MNQSRQLSVTVLALAAVCCKGGSESSAATQDAAAATTVNPEQAGKAAEKPSRAAFEARRKEFERCDKKRLRALYEMGSKEKDTEGPKLLGESRQCLEGFWKDIDNDLAKQNIPRAVWMKHFEAWKNEPNPTKYPLPTGKPLTGGRALSLKGGTGGAPVSVTVPAAWKQKAEKGQKPNERANFELGGTLTAGVSNSLRPETESVDRLLQLYQSSDMTLHAQKYTVDGVEGVLDVYDGGPSVEWRGIKWKVTRDIASDGSGHTIELDIQFKAPSLSDEHKQLFFDVLSTMKISKK